MSKTITMLGTRGLAGRTFHADQSYKIIQDGRAKEDEILAGHADVLVDQGHAKYDGKAPVTLRTETIKLNKAAQKPIGEGEPPKPAKPDEP